MNFKMLALTSTLAVSTVALFSGCDRKVVVEKEHHDRGSDAATPAQEAAPTAAVAPGAAAPDGQAYAPPTYYDEGANYNGAVINEPQNISDYVAINGGWYYWHPSLNIWVHSRHPESWQPPQGAHVYHNWNEHPAYQRDRGRDNRGR